MKKLYIYTDGSHLDKQHNGRLGIGGLAVDKDYPGMGKLIDTFSMELLPSYLEMTYGTSDVSNPTCEMLAALMALKNFKKIIKTFDEVEILADYNGVKYFCEGLWKIKKPYIQRIKNDIDSEIYKQGLKGKITFSWVKGHQKDLTNIDAFWNSKVDLYAKGQIK